MTEVTVVTGGSNGIGLGCVQAAKEKGRKVVNIDIMPEKKPLSDLFIQADLTQKDRLDAAFDQILSQFDVVGLVNNAGAAINHDLAQTGLKDFEELVPLNLIAPMLCTQHVLSSMRKLGWGRIVNIASRVVLGKENRTAYSATKGGLSSMGKGWALELASEGITVNTIAPGPIATDLFERANPPGSPSTEKIRNGVPVKRLGTVHDVARGVMFFLDQDAGFVTGQTLYVCGGMTIGASGH